MSAEDNFFDQYITNPRELFRVTHKSRVLVVDDDPAVREVVSSVLEKKGGYVVDSAEDGVSALEHIQQNPPAVMVLDLKMPRMGGIEVLRHLREELHNTSLRVVVFSGCITPEAEAELAGLGVEAVLPKPFDNNDLLDSVRSVFERIQPMVALQSDVCGRCGSDRVMRSESFLRGMVRYLARSGKRYCKNCGYKWTMTKVPY